MTITITADFASVEDLVKGLENTAAVLAVSGTAAVNAVATGATTRSKVEVRNEVALPTDYVESRITMRAATSANPVATITGRDRPTTLARYNTQQLVTAAKRKGGKGDARRGIPAGMKAAGISVNVKKGAPRGNLPHAFFIPLRAGAASGGNGMGVFTRKDGRLRHRYGPSIDQILRGVWRDMVPDVTNDLETELLRETEQNVKKALGTK